MSIKKALTTIMAVILIGAALGALAMGKVTDTTRIDVDAGNPYFAKNNNNMAKVWYNYKIPELMQSEYIRYLGMTFARIDYKAEQLVFDGINKERKRGGENPLVWNDSLATMARLRAMIWWYEGNGATHDFETHGTTADTFKRYGIKPVGMMSEVAICGYGHKTSKDMAKSFVNELVEDDNNYIDVRGNYRKAGAVGVVIIRDRETDNKHTENCMIITVDR